MSNIKKFVSTTDKNARQLLDWNSISEDNKQIQAKKEKYEISFRYHLFMRNQNRVLTDWHVWLSREYTKFEKLQ